MLHGISCLCMVRKGQGKTKSEKKEPYWKRRIENNIKKWRQDLSKMKVVLYCRIKLGEEERERMDRSYGVSDKGNIHVIHFLKQRIKYCWSKDPSIQPLQYHRNNMFRSDQRQFYKELDEKMNGQTEAPDLLIYPWHG